jgi:hypothetical protein
MRSVLYDVARFAERALPELVRAGIHHWASSGSADPKRHDPKRDRDDDTRQKAELDRVVETLSAGEDEPTADELTYALVPCFSNQRRESFIAIGLTKDGDVHAWRQRGDVDCVSLDLEELAEWVEANEIDRLLIAHNHTHNDPTPSTADRRTTAALRGTYELIDHIVFAEPDDRDEKNVISVAYSFAQCSQLEVVRETQPPATLHAPRGRR